MGICPIIISPGKIGLVKMSSGINKHACMLCGVTKVLKVSLLFLIYRLLKLTLKMIFAIQHIWSNGIFLFWTGLVIYIKCISFYFLSHIRQKENPADCYVQVSAIAIGANHRRHHPHTHEDKKVLNREKPALMRDADMDHFEWLWS